MYLSFKGYKKRKRHNGYMRRRSNIEALDDIPQLNVSIKCVDAASTAGICRAPRLAKTTDLLCAKAIVTNLTLMPWSSFHRQVLSKYFDCSKEDGEKIRFQAFTQQSTLFHPFESELLSPTDVKFAFEWPRHTSWHGHDWYAQTNDVRRYSIAGSTTR